MTKGPNSQKCYLCKDWVMVNSVSETTEGVSTEYNLVFRCRFCPPYMVTKRTLDRIKEISKAQKNQNPYENSYLIRLRHLVHQSYWFEQRLHRVYQLCEDDFKNLNSNATIGKDEGALKAVLVDDSLVETTQVIVDQGKQLTSGKQTDNLIKWLGEQLRLVPLDGVLKLFVEPHGMVSLDNLLKQVEMVPLRFERTGMQIGSPSLDEFISVLRSAHEDELVQIMYKDKLVQKNGWPAKLEEPKSAYIKGRLAEKGVQEYYKKNKTPARMTKPNIC